MKNLKQLAFITVIENIQSSYIGPRLRFLPFNVKTSLLERILLREQLNEKSWPYIVKKEFFQDIERLILHDGHNGRPKQLNDEFMNVIASSGCRLKEFSIFTRGTPNLNDDSVSMLLERQESLETLRLNTWGSYQGVIKRLKSERLKVVRIQGSGECSCEDDTQSYGEIRSLAINHTITHLHLEEIQLSTTDCEIIFSALSNSLEHLVVKVSDVSRHKEHDHALHGTNLIPFLESIDTKCHRLNYLMCSLGRFVDKQNDGRLRFKSNTLKTLSLENHIFVSPIILPSSLETVTLSLDGSESSEYFEALSNERLQTLNRIHILLISEFEAVNESGLAILFSRLGSKIVSIRNILDDDAFHLMSIYICIYCVNLETLTVPYLSENSQADGSELLPLFRDKKRASRLKHLELNIDHLSYELLRFMADNCENLKTLHLDGCRALDDTLLSLFSVNCANLRSLDVFDCSQISDQSVRSMAVNCASLEKVNLQGTAVGDDGISALAMHCNLRECYFDGRISDDVKERLRKSMKY